MLADGLPYSACAQVGMQNVEDETTCMSVLSREEWSLPNYEWKGNAAHGHMTMGCIVSMQSGVSHGYWVTHSFTEVSHEGHSVLCMQGKNHESFSIRS